MPFQSEKQRRYLWANEPEIARDWTDKYGSKIQKAKGGRIPFQYGSSTFSPGIEQILAQNNNFGWDQNVYKQNMLDQYTGIMSKYLPEGTANITSSPVFNRGFKEWNPSGFGSLLTRMALPTMSGTRGLAGSFPGSTGMTLDPLEQFIERAGGNVRQGELDWAETFGHEGTHLGWQYEPKKIGSIFGKDINIPGEFGALSRFGKGGEEKWNYLHDLMYGSGPIMKEQEKRYNEYKEMASKVKGPPSIRPSQDEINRIRGRYEEMPKGSATSLSHLTGETDPGETEVTGKLVNPGDLSLTPQAWQDIQNSGLIPEHKKVLGVGVNPFEDTMMGKMRSYPNAPIGETMGTNWSNLMDTQRRQELSRLAGMEQYPTEDEGEDNENNWFMRALSMMPVVGKNTRSGWAARQLFNKFSGNDGIMSAYNRGYNRTPRDPGYGRGLSGNVSWAGSRYDKEHGTGAYKQKGIQDWHKKYGQMKYKTQKMQQKQQFMKQKADQIAKEKAVAAATAYKGPITHAYDPKQGGGGRPDKPGGFTDPGKGSYGPWS